MSRDLIEERYGRLYYLPIELAARGHAVEVMCLDYTWSKGLSREADGDGVRWQSIPAIPFGFLFFKNTVLKYARKINAEFIIGMSDPLYGIWARQIARELKCGFAFDLYDNFETWASMKMPGVPGGYGKAIANADVVSCVSNRLATYVRERYRPAGQLITVQSVVDTKVFKSLDKSGCRSELGLDLDLKHVGYFGAIDENRGIGNLFKGWAVVRAKYPDAILVLAGKIGKGISIPGEDKGVRYLGMLPHAKMPTAINACDVVTVFNRDSPFGRFCFPQKLCEYMACGVPVVATDLGAVGDFLKDWPQCRYPEQAPDQFAERVGAFLQDARITYGTVPTWSDVVQPWEQALTAAAKS